MIIQYQVGADKLNTRYYGLGYVFVYVHTESVTLAPAVLSLRGREQPVVSLPGAYDPGIPAILGAEDPVIANLPGEGP